MQENGGDISTMNPVNQTNCLVDDEGNFNFDISDNTLGLLNEEQIVNLDADQLAHELKFDTEPNTETKNN